jgi:hypothetical protein
MPKLVQKEIRTVRSFRALVPVLRDTLTAIPSSVEGDALEFELVPLVGPT